MHHCTAWPEHSPFWACLSANLAGCASRPALSGAEGTLPPYLHSSLSIATCSAGSPRWLAVYRLSFPLLTRAYRTHARGRCFHSATWRVRVSLVSTSSTQVHEHSVVKACTEFVEVYDDLAAQPLYLAIQFRANGSHTMHARGPRQPPYGGRRAPGLPLQGATRSPTGTMSLTG
jgi:hypothetical protein